MKTTAEQKDYSKDIEFLKHLSTASAWVDLTQMTARPLLTLAGLTGFRRIARALEGVKDLDTWALRVNTIATSSWKLRHGTRTETWHKSHAVHALSQTAPKICTLPTYSHQLDYVDLYGVPVATCSHDNDGWFYSPAAPSEVLSRARNAGSRWLISADGSLAPDTEPVYPIRSRQTSELIRRIERFDSCRAHVLWGPPRGGKSAAARQIADAVGGGWVRVCGSAARSLSTWEVIRALAPKAIILDDLDTCAQSEDDLLGWMEQARAGCKVIISTMNILPHAQEHGPAAPPGGLKSASQVTSAQRSLKAGPNPAPASRHELRGAIIAPGRARDERPTHYAELDANIAAALAPNVPVEYRSGLLAGYLVELEKRVQSLGSVTAEDYAEQLEAMALVGAR